jgi:membrane protease subunit HflC
MRTVLLALLVVIAAAGAVVVFFSAYIVNQTQQALVLEFGRPLKVVREPGLNWRTPFIQTVEYFDKRILDLDADQQEVIAADQKRLVVDAFARYRIIDPLLFYQAVRNEAGARPRLISILDSSLRTVLGRATFIDVVRDRREALMNEIRAAVNLDARNLGMEIVDVRIKRADLPEANSQAIYRRMQTERQREAAELRAQGTEAAQRIRSDADRQVTVIIAEANRDAERVRGEGDAERNRIYAEAFGRDQDFFSFYRSMQAYEEGLKGTDTRMVLSPNTEFFRFFNNPAGLAAPQGPVRRTQDAPAMPQPNNGAIVPAQGPGVIPQAPGTAAAQNMTPAPSAPATATAERPVQSQAAQAPQAATQ